MFIERDKVDKIITYSDILYREIALRTDSLPYYDRVVLSWGNKSSNMRNLLKHNYIYDADMDIADRYIKNFHEEFEPDINYKLHKCYFDIEVDLMPNGFKRDKFGNIGYIGFPDEDVAPCPINIITLIDAKSLIVYTFICKNNLNESMIEFESKLQLHINEVRDELLKEDGLTVNDIDTRFYNSEEEMIEAFFATVHEIDPDFMMAWNEGFDVKTLMNRLVQIYSRKKELKAAGIRGYDQMLTTVSDSKYLIVKDHDGNDVYLTPKAFYKQNKDTSFVDRMDSFTVLDGIIWIDQMLLYANIRKTNGVKESYSLDAIANEELGKEKLDYTGYTIKNLAWLNFPRFFKYNIKDVVLLVLMENKNLDIDMLQKLSDVTNTRKYKVFKKTISIKNFVNKFAEQQGYVMGNNKNAQYGNDSAYFEEQYLNRKQVVENTPEYAAAFDKKENYGAYVGDPNLNDKCGIKTISGKNSMFLFENVFDEDFSALYPSIIRAYNLDKNTQVGKFFLIDSHIKDKLISEFGYDGLFESSKNDEGEGDLTSNDIGPTLVDSLTSRNWSRIGEKFFDLPSTAQMINELKLMKK